MKKLVELFPIFKKKLFVDTSIYMIGNFISQGIGLLVLPIFTRFLTPEEYGIFNYTNSIKGFLTAFATLSLNSFVLKYYFDLKIEEDRQTLLGSVYYFIFIFNIFLLGVFYLAFPHLIKSFTLNIPFYPFFSIMLINNFLETMLVIPLVNFRIKKQVTKYFFMTSLNAIITVLFGLALVAVYHMGLVGRLYGILIVNIIFAIIGFVYLFKASKFIINFEIIKKGLIFSIPLLPGALASMGTSATDRIILERFVSLTTIGIYSIGQSLGTSILIIIRSFYRAVEPDIFESFKTPDFSKKVVLLKNNFLMLIVFIGFIIITFSKEIVILMTSESFYSAYTVIPIFVMASLMRGAKILADTTLYAMNKAYYETYMIIGTLILNFVLNLLLIPKLGIIGAALATLATYWANLFLSFYISSRYSDIKWGFLKDNFLIFGISFIGYAIMMGASLFLYFQNHVALHIYLYILHIPFFQLINLNLK